MVFGKKEFDEARQIREERRLKGVKAYFKLGLWSDCHETKMPGVCNLVHRDELFRGESLRLCYELSRREATAPVFDRQDQEERARKAGRGGWWE